MSAKNVGLTRAIDPSRFRNTDNDPRGPWLACDLTAPLERPNLHYEWRGHFPLKGRCWRFARARLEELSAEGRICYRSNGRPALKRYLTEVVQQQDDPYSERSIVSTIIRQSMQAIASRLAHHPGEIRDLEWRDMERVLREVFDSLGFATKLTRGAKDGGFDIELSACGQSYLVEVKHWSPVNLVGDGVISRFAEVVVTEQAQRGLLVSTSGFTQKALLGRVEVEQHIVALGDQAKVVSLCQQYVKVEAGIWIASTDLPEILFANTF